MQRILFLGDSRQRLQDFPDEARQRPGHQLFEVQAGAELADWKPMKSVGPGVREIRVRVSAGAFRVLYMLVVGERVLVLHAFEKKTQATPQRDIDLAAKRLREWRGSDHGN